MRPNARILETISRRVEARSYARDTEGLRAIIAASENGLQLARDALADLEPIPKPEPVRTQPRTAETPTDLDTKREETGRARYETKILADLEKQDTSKLYQAIREQGGITPSSSDLREEYRNVPPCYRNPQGMFGDVMAEHLAVHLPELGIQTENDLLAYFAERTTKARNRRAA